jgi:hypothetical protein
MNALEAPLNHGYLSMGITQGLKGKKTETEEEAQASLNLCGLEVKGAWQRVLLDLTGDRQLVSQAEKREPLDEEDQMWSTKAGAMAMDAACGKGRHPAWAHGGRPDTDT